jgi:hypothetical protein
MQMIHYDEGQHALSEYMIGFYVLASAVGEGSFCVVYELWSFYTPFDNRI